MVGFIYGDDDKGMMVPSLVFSDGLVCNVAGRPLGNRYKLCYMIDMTCISEPNYAIYIYTLLNCPVKMLECPVGYTLLTLDDDLLRG